VAVFLAVLAALAPASAAALPDGRGWELVSPVAKNGGEIPAAEEVFAGGVFAAAAGGGAVTYSSSTSFAAGPAAAPPGSQYLSIRGAAGWATQNLNLPLFSGSYGDPPDGVPYQLFSSALDRALILNGRHCRAEEASCPVANPPLPGTDAPAGYQNYYLRSGLGFEALVGTADVANSAVAAAAFQVRLLATSPDFASAILQSCAALVPGALEVPLAGGCDPARQNLYRFSGGNLSLINPTPGAALAAQAGAVSTNAARVYFLDSSAPGEPKLFLREGASLKQVDDEAGGGGTFQATGDSGAIAYFTKGGHLWSYSATADTATDLTPAGGVAGVLAASPDGSRVYYLAADGLYSWVGGIATKIAATADASNSPPATGTARVSADGLKLLFVSTTSLTGYNNLDQKTGLPDAEIYLYDSASKGLRCISCRANGTRPIGPSTIPGAYANGQAADATRSYKPRVFSTDGKRVFFDSEDALVGGDVNKEPDVYEWQSFGPGCTKPAGCAELISSGRSAEGARFIDASASGDDVFFVTDGSLVKADPGAFDLYDARVGGGFPEAEDPIPCEGDACQDLPSDPVDPALNTLVSGPGNPKVRYFKYRRAQNCKGKATKKTKRCERRAKKQKQKQQGKKQQRRKGSGR
jgi:hypothetical protein